ncbi:MAG: hypothetical protein K9K67_13955 [Bacteriovoracaceae bacterium]|nr:hypothetical protein [Bacteriovoracaceae bacterium]
MWIHSKLFDALWIIGPAFLSVSLVFFLSLIGLIPKTVTPLYWLILVVFIDVAHVWSTLFRTYLNKSAYQSFKNQMWLVPLICYVAGVFLHTIGELAFWRTLAYLAVFHFVRQQYGLFSIYKGKENSTSQDQLIDKITIYSCSIIPLMIWHFSGPQEFHWFQKGDFIYSEDTSVITPLKILGPTLIFIYFLKEKLYYKREVTNPKNLIVLGTYLSWWTGIVWIRTDWSFTITNVVTHGIPYFALIYLNHLKDPSQLYWPKIIPISLIPLFLCLLAFLEEGFWDTLIWREHLTLFSSLHFLTEIKGLSLKALIVPLLALPQATHYILDGFIWKRGSFTIVPQGEKS